MFHQFLECSMCSIWFFQKACCTWGCWWGWWSGSGWPWDSYPYCTESYEPTHGLFGPHHGTEDAHVVHGGVGEGDDQGQDGHGKIALTVLIHMSPLMASLAHILGLRMHMLYMGVLVRVMIMVRMVRGTVALVVLSPMSPLISTLVLQYSWKAWFLLNYPYNYLMT